MRKEGENSVGKTWNSRGQVTMFIIIAIVIVGVAVLIYFLSSNKVTSTDSGLNTNNPNGFIQTCLQDEIQTTIDTISAQGGSLSPQNFFLYQGDKLDYLCYTNEYYKTCSVQQPLLKQHIESQIQTQIKDEVASCFDALKKSYEDKGYTAQLQAGTTKVELLPKRVVTTMSYVLTVTKSNTERYDSFNIVLNNNLYELVSIANSIVDWESTYGDAETTTYMDYYKDLKVEKHKQNDGTTVYIITDRNTGSSFQFASRSVAWPPGYGLDGVSTA